MLPNSQATIDKKSTPAKPKPIDTNVDESRNNNQLDSKTYKESQIVSKFYGINDQDIDYKSNNALSNQEANKTGSQTMRKRIPGLSQEYPVKKPQLPEAFTHRPQIKKYHRETDQKKRSQALRLLKETSKHDKTEQLRDLIKKRILKRDSNMVLA